MPGRTSKTGSVFQEVDKDIDGAVDGGEEMRCVCDILWEWSDYENENIFKSMFYSNAVFSATFLILRHKYPFPKVGFSFVSVRQIWKEKKVYIRIIPTDPHWPLHLLLLQPGLPHLPDVRDPLDWVAKDEDYHYDETDLRQLDLCVPRSDPGSKMPVLNLTKSKYTGGASFSWCQPADVLVFCTRRC